MLKNMKAEIQFHEGFLRRIVRKKGVEREGEVG